MFCYLSLKNIYMIVNKWIVLLQEERSVCSKWMFQPSMCFVQLVTPSSQNCNVKDYVTRNKLMCKIPNQALISELRRVGNERNHVPTDICWSQMNTCIVAAWFPAGGFWNSFFEKLLQKFKISSICSILELFLISFWKLHLQGYAHFSFEKKKKKYCVFSEDFTSD